MGLESIARTLITSVKDFFTDNGPQWAAAIAYYSLLSTFPLLLAIASISAFFVSPEWAIEQSTRILGDYLPPQGQSQLENTIREAINQRGSVSLISLPLFLWSGSRVFGVLVRALNVAYDVDDPYSFLKRTLVEFLMLLTVGMLFIVALISRFLINLAQGRLNIFPNGQNPLFPILLEVVPVLLLLLAFFLIYRFVPRKAVDWRAALAGAVLATLIFSIARPVFTGYVSRFANYNLIYGSLAIVIILVLWAWITGVILLFGGEVVSHIQVMLIERIPAEEVEERHSRRSQTAKERERA